MVQARTDIAKIAEQIGSTLLPDNGHWTNRFQVQSTSSAKLYTIAQQRSDGRWGCSCPGWRHYRRCRHLKDVLSRLAKLADRAVSFDKIAMSVLSSARMAYLDLDPPKEIAQPSLKGRVLDL